MQFSELKAAFQTYTGVGDSEVDDVELALWLNEAQLDLSYDFGERGSQEYSATANTEYDLPIDALNIIDCTKDYSINALGKVVFDEDCTATLYYRKVPTDFTGLSLTQESTLHSALHRLMPIYAASRFFDQESEGDSEESNHANKWMGYYYQGKKTAISKLNAVTAGSVPTSFAII